MTDTDRSLIAAHYTLTTMLQPVRRAWVQAASVVLADTGLPMSLASAVLLVHRQKDSPIGQSALAEKVGVNQGALVRLLDQGEAAGLLERRTVPGDRRAKTVHILPKGRELAGRMEKAVVALRRELLGDIPEADIDTTIRTLGLFEDRIGAFLQQSRDKP